MPPCFGNSSRLTTWQSLELSKDLFVAFSPSIAELEVVLFSFNLFRGSSLFRLPVAILLFIIQGVTTLQPKAAPMPAPIKAPLLAGNAYVSIGGLDIVPIGQDVSFSVSFENVGSTPGYGSFIDVILNTTGTDGVYPGTPASNANDG